jgi:hypothetical protein
MLLCICLPHTLITTVCDKLVIIIIYFIFQIRFNDINLHF